MSAAPQSHPSPLSSEDRTRMRAEIAESRAARAEYVRIAGEAQKKIEACDRLILGHVALLCADAALPATVGGGE